MIIEGLPFYRRKFFKWFLDNFFVSCALIFSLFFRLGPTSFFKLSTFDVLFVISFVPLSLTFSSLFFRTYTTSWKFFSTQDLRGFFGFYITFYAVFMLACILTESIGFIPRSSILLFSLLSFILMVAVRAFYKLKRELVPVGNRLSRKTNNSKGGLVYIGALEKLDGWVKGINLYQGQINYDIIGAIADNNSSMRGVYVRGIPVLGSFDDLEEITNDLVKQENVKGFLVEEGLSPKDVKIINQIAKVTSNFGLKLFKIPTPQGIQGNDRPQNIKPVEISDLLGRKQRAFEAGTVKQLLNGKTVAITGAGGSIGSELVKQISQFDVEQIILIENSEYNLYQIETWLKTHMPNKINKISFDFADIRDRNKIDSIFSKYKPDVVYHAAALKHVPLMESNQIECIKTNILGTKNIVDAAIQHQVDHFTLISTDKAVNPENIMGFTKRIAELYCQSTSSLNPNTKFSIVRFGNVLGSSGSVIPLFSAQIQQGGPVTVTHEETTRFFMTIPEAVQLVLQTGKIKKTKDTDIFVLEMGKPVKILSLAEKMIRLSGLQPYTDIQINVIGLRPGEKLHEELYIQAAQMEKTSIEGILVTDSMNDSFELFLKKLNSLNDKSLSNTASSIINELIVFVPENKLNLSSSKVLISSEMEKHV